MIDYKDVHLGTPEIRAALMESVPMRKAGYFLLRFAFEGEKITTVDTDGGGTEKVARFGDVVVRGQRGEVWLVPGRQIPGKYRHVSGDAYEAIGFYRMIRNPWGVPIQTVAPWGETQRQGADCWIATRYDPDDPGYIDENIYLVAADSALYVPA